MNSTTLKIIKESKCRILKEISKDTIYLVAHDKLSYGVFYISLMDENILLSLRLGEYKSLSKVINKKERKRNYVKSLLNCLKESRYEKYRPMSKLENNDLPHEYENDERFVRFGKIENAFGRESAILEKNDIKFTLNHDVGNYLVQEFSFKVENLESKLELIQEYLEYEKDNIETFIK